MMFSKFWTQSDVDWSVKLDDSGSYDVRSEMEWLSYPLDFAQNTPNYPSHHIMMFPKFWTQSDIDWSVKLDDSGSYEVRSEMEWLFWTQSDIDWSVKLHDSGSYDVRYEMEWLVYCIVLSIAFRSKHTELLLPPYYDVPQVLDSTLYRLFWTQSDVDWSVKLDDSGSYDVRSEMEWLFWTQSDIDWSVKLDDSGSYDVRSEMEWLFYALDFTQNTPNDSSNHIMMFPKFWTQSDINWSVKLDDSGSYDVRSEMEWLVYYIILSI
ncbi:unnamed protein product [Prunus armeniaca]